MVKVFLPSESTKQEIMEALDKGKHTRQNTSQRGNDGRIDHEEHQAPETYIAKTPSEGISALVGDVPGYADCDIWRIIGESGTPVLRKLGALFHRVYNIEEVHIEGGIWVPITRDKAGSWLILRCCGGEGLSSSSSSEDEGPPSESQSQSESISQSESMSGGCTPVRVLDDIDIVLDLVSCTIEKTPIYKCITIVDGCIVEVDCP